MDTPGVQLNVKSITSFTPHRFNTLSRFQSVDHTVDCHRGFKLFHKYYGER